MSEHALGAGAGCSGSLAIVAAGITTAGDPPFHFEDARAETSEGLEERLAQVESSAIAERKPTRRASERSQSVRYCVEGHHKQNKVNSNKPGCATTTVRAKVDDFGRLLDAVVADGDLGAAPAVVVDVAGGAALGVPNDLSQGDDGFIAGAGPSTSTEANCTNNQKQSTSTKQV